MGIINQTKTEVQIDEDCCQWRHGHEAHHDCWLAKLKSLTVMDLTALVEELDWQQNQLVLDDDRILGVDIADIARAHKDELPLKAVQVADSLAGIAAHYPPRADLQVLLSNKEQF